MDNNNKKKYLLISLICFPVLFLLPVVSSFLLDGIYRVAGSPLKEILYWVMYAVREVVAFAIFALITWTFAIYKRFRIASVVISVFSLLIPYLASLAQNIDRGVMAGAGREVIEGIILNYLLEIILMGFAVLIATIAGAKIKTIKKKEFLASFFVILPYSLFYLGKEIYYTASFVYDLKNYYYDTMTSEELGSIIASFGRAICVIVVGYFAVVLIVKLLDKIFSLSDNPVGGSDKDRLMDKG